MSTTQQAPVEANDAGVVLDIEEIEVSEAEVSELFQRDGQVVTH